MPEIRKGTTGEVEIKKRETFRPHQNGEVTRAKFFHLGKEMGNISVYEFSVYSAEAGIVRRTVACFGKADDYIICTDGSPAGGKSNTMRETLSELVNAEEITIGEAVDIVL